LTEKVKVKESVRPLDPAFDQKIERVEKDSVLFTRIKDQDPRNLKKGQSG
jgi:hypothetical protein